MTHVIYFRRKNFTDSMMVCECNDPDAEYKGWAVVMVNHELGAYVDHLVCLGCSRNVMFERGVLQGD
jgi:hypothetical protein